MNITEKIKKLPQQSGVYLFKDQKGDIIYIGKAISLKNRVCSYFNKSHLHSAKVSQMIDRIFDIEYITTASEMEALLLESNLVKRNKPYFNTQLKDDKSYPYIQIIRDHAFPSIHLVRKNRKSLKNRVRYYGPFIDVETTRKAVKKLRQIFKIRNCSQRKYKTGKPCLDYQIGLCSAPCAGKIDQNGYQKNVKQCCLLLSGQHNTLLRGLKQEMKISSQLMLYEKAAKIRDTIKMIEKVINQAKISKTYQRKLDGYQKGKINDASLKKALFDLKNYLGLPTIPLYIEAFDISNIHGQLAVGSMIVFQFGVPDKKRYRHFKIRDVKGINDFAMMREVIYRRFRDSHLKMEPLPDLILVDGGKGQLNIVKKVLHELNVRLNLVALAKKEEELFQSGEKEPILLPRNSEVFFLIQRIRDEAHRFAIRYHKKLRSKLIRSSVIDFIPGMGEKRKNQLLSKFKSIEDIRKAEVEELKQIPGIGEKTAHKIKDILEVRNDFEVQW
jgi:excinuclease ABC subunit C